jgi:hypothetical protein
MYTFSLLASSSNSFRNDLLSDFQSARRLQGAGRVSQTLAKNLAILVRSKNDEKSRTMQIRLVSSSTHAE